MKYRILKKFVLKEKIMNIGDVVELTLAETIGIEEKIEKIILGERKNKSIVTKKTK